MKEETIAAIATPAGEGGIGIIRISGPDAKNILSGIFAFGNNSADEIGREDFVSHTLTYGHIFDPRTKEPVDEVMVCYMKAPATYTREDVVEINCHGGRIPLSRTLELVLSEGARMAEPGEFTKRAFLNGRLDLSQAEAVIDVINAKTDASLDVALKQLEGKFSSEISEIREALQEVLINISVNIDYPDEDIEEITYEKLTSDLKSILENIENLLKSSKSGKILRDGFTVVILGKPNVGKSSLMNGLLREARAIVTEIPGTTRDTIEEFVNIKGIPVRLIDTAGIRETADPVEKLGIERSRESLEEADLVMLLIDASEEITEEDRHLREMVSDYPAVIIFNKEDKGLKLTDAEIKDFAGALPHTTISLKDKEGVEEAEKIIFDASGFSEDASKVSEEKTFAQEDGSPKSKEKNLSRKRSIVTNVRHQNMLNAAKTAITDAINGAEKKAPLEIIEIDISSAYENLGFITGDSVREDIIDQVFSRFCLGK